jgi:putative tricarboxylic transport membrane protein
MAGGVAEETMGVDWSIVAEGMGHAVSAQNLLWLAIGVTLGLISGTLPGLGGGSMMAVLLPVVVTLPVDTMLITLAGLYAANVYADSTTGILYNIPGGAAGVPASIEGYKLKQQGRLEEAFAAQVSGAFVGATVGFVVLLVLVPSFIYFVQFFGSAERALLAVWALVFISSGAITADSPLQSFLSVGFGLSLGLIGQQPNIGTFRFTMGIDALGDGLKVVLLVLGLFAIPQLLAMIDVRRSLQGDAAANTISFTRLYRSMWRVPWEGRQVVTRTSLLGVIIGIIPGIGPSTAAWVGYSIARAKSTQPERMGAGNRDGVLGPESASNACEVGTIIPLLALGIPGSAAAAIMLGALNLVGIYPGPGMYASHGAQVWSVMFGIGLSGIMFTLLAFPFIRGAQHLSRLPVSVLIGGIGTLCVMGAYLETQDQFGIVVMLVLGVLTLLGSPLGLKAAPVLIGFVLGPRVETELIRAYQIRGLLRFAEPASLLILAVIVATLALAIHRSVKARRAPPADDARPAPPQSGALQDAIFAGLGLALAACLVVFSYGYPLLAKLWVLVVAAGFVAIPSLLLLRRAAVARRDGSGRRRASAITSTHARLIVERAALLALFLLFVVAMPAVGFIISAAAFVFCITLYFERRIVLALMAALVTGLLIFAMSTSFGFYLPTGIFEL